MSRFFALLFLGGWIATLLVSGNLIRGYEARILEQHRQFLEERQRNAVLDRALDILTKHKFKKRDAVWSAIQEVNHASR